jgi:PAS domain S-box-containing protein
MSDSGLPHILVVEDEAIVAMQIVKILHKLGYTTCSAASGEDAIKVAKAEKPDLALMDIMLAGIMDGIQTAAYLARHYGTPIVYLTANADESTVNRAKLTEPYGYILKPFQEARLRNTIDVALHRHAVAKRIKEGSESCLPALEGVEDAIFTSDAEGRLIYMNLTAEALTGSDLDHARGANLAELFQGFTEDRRRILREAIQHAAKTGVTVDLTSHRMRPSANGAAAYNAHSVVPIGPGKGEITGVVLIFRNPGSSDVRDRVPIGLAPTSTKPVSTGPRSPSTAIEEGGKDDRSIGRLPSRGEAEKAIEIAVGQATHRYTAAFVLDRFDMIRHRFGTRAAQEVLLFYSIHLAQSMGPTDLLFHWGGPAFLMLLDRSSSVTEIQREISSCAGVRLEKVIEATSHTAMLVVSGKWRLFDAIEAGSPQALMEQIDGFTGVRQAQ